MRRTRAEVARRGITRRKIAVLGMAATLLMPAAAGSSSLSDITRSCVGFDNMFDLGNPNSFIFDEVEVVNPEGGTYRLVGEAFGSISYDQVPVEQHASATVRTDGVTLNPSDFCQMSAGNIITSVVFGRRVDDPTATGMVDALLRFDYSATLEYQSLGGGEWQSFSGVNVSEITDLGPNFLDSFRVAASTAFGTEAPAGFTFADLSSNGVTRFQATGSRELPISFKYGPEARNVIEVVFFGGGQLDGFALETTTTAAGSASFLGLDTLSTEIESLDPNVELSFSAFPVPEPDGTLLVLAALVPLAMLRRSTRLREWVSTRAGSSSPPAELP